jgi:hypothetical protein
MGLIGVGGDTSVQWIVQAQNVRRTLVQSNGTVHSHEGIDETDRGGQFTVAIAAPREPEARAEFYKALQRAIDRESDIKVTIPIEDRQSGRRNPRQVQVFWESSRKVAPTTKSRRLATLKS